MDNFYSSILLGVLSGCVAALIIGLVVHRVLVERMETKMKDYTEVLVKYQHQMGTAQTKQVEQLRGEVNHLGDGVHNLEHALSNVKIRGMYGEWQLGAVIQEILRPEQYETECMIIPGSQKRVEYAVKMPGYDGHPVYLPIDSKFPLDAYLQLQQAKREEDISVQGDAQDLFRSRVMRFAKEVHDKYVHPPYTTDFAILFFPFESVYAEVLQMEVISELMIKYRIIVAGPSSLAAILNSLQVGFRNVALSEESAQIWDALSEVREEMGRFEQSLAGVQKRISQADQELEQLVGVRTRRLKKKLEDFDSSGFGNR